MTAADLEDEKLLLLEEGHCLRDQALEVCAHIGTEEQAFRATSLETLRQMVASGLGLTLLPELAADGPFAVGARTRRAAIRAARAAPHGRRGLAALQLARRGDRAVCEHHRAAPAESPR